MRRSQEGFTLVELMFVIVIMSVVVTGLISLFIFVSVQAELAGRKTIAVSAAQNKIEEIRNQTYDNITTNYASGGTPGKTFSISQINGMGVVYLDTTNAPCSTELICLEVDVSWRNKYGRMMGDDLDLDGQIDAGEDIDGNNKLDSPVKLMSMITRR